MKKETETQYIDRKAEKNYGLCLIEDLFLEDKPIWTCVLSNGLTVYQDDERPGIAETCAWKRLGKYVKDNGLDIVGMYIKFRSHTEEVRPSCDQTVAGFYFSYAIIKSFNETVERKHYTCGLLVVNEENESNLKYDWFLVPEIIKTQCVHRALERKDLEDGRVILNRSSDLSFLSKVKN